MQKRFIRVRAIGDGLVQDLDAMEAGVKRFIGRKPKPQEGETLYNGDPLYNTVGVDWVPTEEPVQVAYHHEYRQAVHDGDLEVADAESAKLCSVRWDDNPIQPSNADGKRGKKLIGF